MEPLEASSPMECYETLRRLKNSGKELAPEKLTHLKTNGFDIEAAYKISNTYLAKSLALSLRGELLNDSQLYQRRQQRKFADLNLLVAEAYMNTVQPKDHLRQGNTNAESIDIKRRILSFGDKVHKKKSLL
jgi:hypothetical protein